MFATAVYKTVTLGIGFKYQESLDCAVMPVEITIGAGLCKEEYNERDCNR